MRAKRYETTCLRAEHDLRKPSSKNRPGCPELPWGSHDMPHPRSTSSFLGRVLKLEVSLTVMQPESYLKVILIWL